MQPRRRSASFALPVMNVVMNHRIANCNYAQASALNEVYIQLATAHRERATNGVVPRKSVTLAVAPPAWILGSKYTGGIVFRTRCKGGRVNRKVAPLGSAPLIRSRMLIMSALPFDAAFGSMTPSEIAHSCQHTCESRGSCAASPFGAIRISVFFLNQYLFIHITQRFLVFFFFC